MWNQLYYYWYSHQLHSFGIVGTLPFCAVLFVWLLFGLRWYRRGDARGKFAMAAAGCAVVQAVALPELAMALGPLGRLRYTLEMEVTANLLIFVVSALSWWFVWRTVVAGAAESSPIPVQDS